VVAQKPHGKAKQVPLGQDKSEDLPLTHLCGLTLLEERCLNIYLMSAYARILLLSFLVTIALSATAGTVCHRSSQFRCEVDEPDSIRELEEIVVTAESKTNTAVSTAPLQRKTKVDIEAIPAIQVSDVLKHLSGVSIKDYGGIGGLKTVSVRSLGAAHTAVSYDGITVADGQNGQIDISRFSLDNINSIELSNGQNDNIFVPARSMASAALLSIQTVKPSFQKEQKVTGSVSFKGGSFTTLNPAFFLAARLSNKLSLTANADYLYSKGDYPYTLHYGSSETDSTSIERRQNSDVSNLHAEATLFGSDSLNDGYIKAYYYRSNRGLPGATIFYNTASFSSQRLNEQIAFVQGHYNRHLSSIWDLQLNAKYNFSYTHYKDPAALNSAGIEENHYLQNEYYLDVAAQVRPLTNLAIALATDGIVSTMDADLINFARPVRTQWLISLSLKYVKPWVTLIGTALLNAVWDYTQADNQTTSRFKCSPYISASFKPFVYVKEDLDIRFRIFYKNIYRLPTFNDLYYGRVGNRDLKPEDTNQINFGATYTLTNKSFLSSLVLSADIYHNDVTDKIVAYPTKNVFTWTMLNYGHVSICGLDLSADIDFELYKGYHLELATTYTYNRAVNITDQNSPDYGHQIPYTPRISGSANATLRTPYINIAYSLIWSGVRYAVNQNYAENRLPAYYDHSLTASHDFALPKRQSISLALEILNLTDTNYEVIRYFPMPGRQFRGSVRYNF